MVNNMNRKKIYYDKDMKRDEIVSKIMCILSVFASCISFMKVFLDTSTTLFVVAIILILILPYLGCKYDEMRGYN